MAWLRFGLLTLLLSPAPLFAQKEAKIVDPDPEIERKSFIVPEGFEVNLYAADPLLAKPIQMNFDARGRLWLACSETYPQIKPGQKANDKIVVLEDTTGAGKADKVTVFADGLLIPTGIEPGDGGAYVANSTELLHLKAGKDGKAESRTVVLSGFGTEDTHHILHTLRWGPEGLLYFNQSIYIHSHIETPHGVKHLNAGGIWRYRTRDDPRSSHVFARGFGQRLGAPDRQVSATVIRHRRRRRRRHQPRYARLQLHRPRWATPAESMHGLNPGSPKHCGLEIISGRHLPGRLAGQHAHQRLSRPSRLPLRAHARETG